MNENLNKPNIVFVFADQLRADVLRCYGDKQGITPNFDQLASEGMLFKNAIANSPVCGPSRASLLTGRYPLQHKVITNDLPLNKGQESVATLLKKNGYKTGYIGKWHLDGEPRDKFTPPGPRRQGFDDYWAVYNCTHDYFDTKYYLDTPKLMQSEEYEPVHQTNLAIECMEQWKEDDEPFCLFLSWGPPHDPYDQVPDKYKELYTKPIQARRNCPKPNQEVLRDYYAAVTALDEQMGRIMEYLTHNGLDENTLLVFTSDHGDMLGSQGLQLKQLPFEESIHIPLIMKWKGRFDASVRNDLIGVVDFAPTLLGLAGFQMPFEMQGSDLSSTLIKPDENADVSHTSVPIMNIEPSGNALKPGGEKRPWRGVRTKRYTYARFLDEPWFLYDNLNDPYQQNNLVYHDEYKEVKESLQQELEGWLSFLGDEFLDRTKK